MQMKKQEKEMEEGEEEFWVGLDEEPVPVLCVEAFIIALFLGLFGVSYILAKFILFFIFR